MQTRDDVVGLKHARLKDAIDRGYDEASAGRVTQLETEDEIDDLFDSL